MMREEEGGTGDEDDIALVDESAAERERKLREKQRRIDRKRLERKRKEREQEREARKKEQRKLSLPGLPETTQPRHIAVDEEQEDLLNFKDSDRESLLSYIQSATALQRPQATSK